MTGRTVMPVSASRKSSSYDDPMACYRCYAKHLSKAYVEASEYIEDVGRAHEFAQCIGNMACAEDHANALGLTSDATMLRGMRDRIWSADPSIPKSLLNMAASAVASFRMMEEAERRRQTPSAPEGGTGPADSGDSNDSAELKSDA